jgi:hypothetical protein
LPIQNTKIIKPDNIPEGSKFKGYTDIVVQDLIIEINNTCYRLAQYETPNGQYITGQLPEGIRDNHWGKTQQSFIIYQYHHQHVTQPLLLEHTTRFEYRYIQRSIELCCLCKKQDIFHNEFRRNFMMSPERPCPDTSGLIGQLCT